MSPHDVWYAYLETRQKGDTYQDALPASRRVPGYVPRFTMTTWECREKVEEQQTYDQQASYGSAQSYGNTSGQGLAATVPAEVQGLN